MKTDSRVNQESRDTETYQIIGAAVEVHRVLGCGFLEAVYQEALAREFALRGIMFVREVELPVVYKDKPLDVSYRADFVCFEKIIVELKAIEKLREIDKAQIINYLKATGFQRGLLFNFGARSLEYERLIYTPEIVAVRRNLGKGTLCADEE